MSEKAFSFPKVSKQTVLAKIIFTYELSRRWAKNGIQACTICPGLTETDMVSDFPWYVKLYMNIRFSVQRALSPEEAGANMIKLVDIPEINGKYYEASRNGFKESRSSDESYDVEVAHRLWIESEILVSKIIND